MMHEIISKDFGEILDDGLNASTITLRFGQETYDVRAIVEPVRFSADALPGGFRPRAAFAATLKRKDLKSFPAWGSPVLLDGKPYSVVNVTGSTASPLVVIKFCER